MNCPKCGAENPDGAKFCSKCGQNLVVAAEAAPVSAAPAVPVSAGTAPKGSNALIIVIIILLIAVIGAAGAGWYLWSKNQSAPGASSSASVPPGAAGQPGSPQVDANGMPIPQSGVQGQAGTGQQPGMPQVDANGMPIPQSGTQGQAGANGQQPGMQGGQPGADGQQPGASGQQPQGAYGQQGVGGQQSQDAYGQQDVMPEPMPQEARKRRAAGENPSPRRGVHSPGTIDEQFNRRAAVECPSGGNGFFCRQKLRYQLCDGRWSASPPPGQSMCQK